MANLVQDGFEWFLAGQSSAVRQALLSANNFYIDAFGGSIVPDVGAGRFGYGQALNWNLVHTTFPTRSGYAIPIGKSVSQGYQGFALYRDPTTDGTVFILAGAIDGSGGGCQIQITFEQFGVIRVYRDWVWNSISSAGPTGVLLASSLAGAFNEGEWCHVEIFYQTAAVGGSVEVRINTVPKIQLVGANTDKTGSGLFDATYLGVWASASGGSTAVKFSIDDLFFNDTSGTYNNSWSGNLRVKSQFMTANGATVNFTIGGSAPAATHWQSVLNQALDDTKYEFSSNVGDIDLFVPDPNLNSPLVRSVQVRMALRQDDATQRAAQAVLRIGGTNYPSAVNAYVNQTYTFYCQRWEVNPATGVTFTGTDVNGLQAGLKLAA